MKSTPFLPFTSDAARHLRPGFARIIRLAIVLLLIEATCPAASAVSSASLPSVATAPAGVYGLKKLIDAYSGPAVRVMRVSDGVQQDIGFAGSDLDTSTALAFRGASVLKVLTVYDQTGHGNHLTQETPANQPVLYLDKGAPSIVLGGFLTIPATLTADRANVSMLAVTRDVDSYVTGGLFYMGATTGPMDLGLQGFVSCFASQPVYDDKLGSVTPNDGSTVGTASAAIVGIVSSPTGITIHRDGNTGTSAAVSSKMMTGGGQFGRTLDAPGRQDMLAWVFYPAALSDPDVTEVKNSLKTIFATNSWTPSLNVALQGDSKTFGVDTPNNLTLARQLSTLLPGAVIRNMGVSGQTINENKTKFTSPRFKEAGAVNVIGLYEGTNDLGGASVHGGDRAEAIWGYYQTFVAGARANGWDRVVCCTITPRSIGNFTPAMETQRVLLNQMIRANKDHLFDAIADFDGIAALGPAEHPNLTYQPDGLHETEAAYALEAPVLAEAIQAAVAAPVYPSATTAPTVTAGIKSDKP